MTRTTIERTFAIGAAAAFALGSAPMAKAERKECSVATATLEGNFERRDTGYVTMPTGNTFRAMQVIEAPVLVGRI